MNYILVILDEIILECMFRECEQNYTGVNIVVGTVDRIIPY
jgi:hypothetical protein